MHIPRQHEYLRATVGSVLRDATLPSATDQLNEIIAFSYDIQSRSRVTLYLDRRSCCLPGRLRFTLGLLAELNEESCPDLCLVRAPVGPVARCMSVGHLRSK